MASPEKNYTAKNDSYSTERSRLFRSILPWKTQPAAKSADENPAIGDARDAQTSKPGQLIGAAKPEMLTPAEVHRLYAGTSVPQHRYLAPSLAAAVDSPEIALDPSKWFAELSEINLTSVVDAWLNTNRSTEFEQLNCIGLDAQTGQLTGVLRLKRGSGYSGGPSTAGSKEFVAFWVDWGSGFEYEGTTSVAVHDFGCLPPAGLEYNVSLPVDLRSRVREYSKIAKSVKVRAVLCWGSAPSTTDPSAPVVWGNCIESRIPIPSDHATGAGSQAPRTSSAAGRSRGMDGMDGMEGMDRTGAGGPIIHAAIQALTGKHFGPNAGLTVVPDSALTGPRATSRAITFSTTGTDDRGYSLTLIVWDRTSAESAAASNRNTAQTGFCRG
jgi:hypothetical protein